MRKSTERSIGVIRKFRPETKHEVTEIVERMTYDSAEFRCSKIRHAYLPFISDDGGSDAFGGR